MVHVNDCLSADGPSAGNSTVMWESENDECSYSKLFFISRNAFFFFASLMKLGRYPALHFSSSTILHNKTFSLCSDELISTAMAV